MATTENLNTLKIHKLSQEQYDREKEAGRLDNSAIYLTPGDSDGGVPSNMVTTDTDQTVNGLKTFTSMIWANSGVWASGTDCNAGYNGSSIFVDKASTGEYKTLLFPVHNSGVPETLATQEWVDASYGTFLTAIFSIDEANTAVDLSNFTASYIDWGDGNINTEYSHTYTTSGVLRTCKIYGVTAINDNAFSNNNSLVSITIPDSVTTIGFSAFEGCSSLTSITIPDSVTSIGNWAFGRCSSLTSVVIPNSVTSIGECAFEGCSSLTEITIPFIGGSKKSVADFNTVFGYIFGYIISTNTNSIEGTTYQYNDGTNYYHYYIPASLKKVTITGGTIGEWAFQNCSSLTSVVIRDSVTSIGNGAFQFCSNLTSVVIGDGVTGIGNYAFYGCSSLTKIVIPDSVTSIGNWAFEGCSRLKSIEIPDSVTTIGDSAFNNCDSLMNIEIPNCVTSIGVNMFANCSSLTSIVIPDSVTSISTGAFTGCTSLTNVVIGNSVTSISDFVFYGCSSLESVVIPDNVTSIGHEAFCDCDSLTEITIPFVGATKDGTISESFDYIFGSVPETLKKVKVTGGNIGDGAFDSCSSLTSVVIPDSVTSIGAGAFRYCSSLTSVEIPDSVTSIGEYAFDWCTSLTSITIPDSVTSIGNWAFEGCSRLTVYCEAESMPSSWAAGLDSEVDHVVWDYKKHVPAIENNIYNHLYAQELHAENSVELGLVEGKDSVGLIKNGSTKTSATGYTACPIISGVPYYRGVDSTTSTNTLYLIGATATGNTSATTKAASGVSVVNKQVIADSFCANSDLRLKENITEFKPQTSILELPIVEFDFKETGTHQIGCIAQDLQKICPEIVEQGQDGFLKIQESKIVYLLLDEVKKLRAELEQLKEGKN